MGFPSLLEEHIAERENHEMGGAEHAMTHESRGSL